MSRRNTWRLFLVLGLLFTIFLGWWSMIRMPGKSYRAKPAAFSPEQAALRDELARHVQVLAGEIGERNMLYYPQLQAAADYIERSFVSSGLKVRRDSYELEGKRCDNVEAEIPGVAPEIVLIGAHYDSVLGSPGANDNGSGVAALLSLSRRFAGKTSSRTLRFVAFVNEEPPYFQTSKMGSFVYAARCKDRGDKIVGMISIETIGYFSEQPRSQTYPLPGLGVFYPTKGNFIGFVSNVQSRTLLRRALLTFRGEAQIPSEGAALPGGVPGVSWSDQWSFWQHGYPGIMVTDTALFRYPHYHDSSDTPDKLTYDSMTRVVEGLERVIHDLANGVDR